MTTFIGGYVLVWVSLVLYVGWMAHRQRRLARQYARWQQQMERAAQDDPPHAKAA